MMNLMVTISIQLTTSASTFSVFSDHLVKPSSIASKA